jgi:predicted alpha-1,2-mannosidase
MNNNIKIKKSTFLSVIWLLLSFTFITNARAVEDFTQFVNPFIGTAGNGHTFPGACLPFGMIQAGPETGNYSWDYCAGYQHGDTITNGFSQTRLNGTGCKDLSDVLILPFTGEPVRKQYTARLGSEEATPGYYATTLTDSDIKAEVTAAENTALYRFTYNGNEQARMLVDLQNGLIASPAVLFSHVIEANSGFVNDTTITGFATTKMWLLRKYYYTIRFSKPIASYQQLGTRDFREKASRYVLDFDLKPGEELLVKVSMSATGIDGAQQSMQKEIPGWDFKKIMQAARDKWNDYLSVVKVEGSLDKKINFYTALYHLLIQPNNIADAGQDKVYSTFSLWDTYRAAHPLYTILTPQLVDEFINSMLIQYKRQGFLPIWALWGNETYTMIGNHAVPVIVDAYLKGFRGFDVDLAYDAVRTSLTRNLPKSDYDVYDKYGYYPYDLVKKESVSRTLEGVYDDYCAMLFANELGKNEDEAMFAKRTHYYKNLFDPATGLMRGKDTKGNWRTPFNPFQLTHSEATSGADYTEGNAWQYTWHVQHDVDGLIKLMGGNESFTKKLDTLFTVQVSEEVTGKVSDVSGLIGQYAHGNEPSHHVAYLYTMAGKPWKTQELVNEICNTQYLNKPDGLSGNEDCGQMSSWFIFSSFGFYPVNPCGGEYIIGAPQLPKAVINLPGNKTFTITAKNFSDQNIYVQSVSLNGKVIKDYKIHHNDIMNGGELTFVMTKKKPRK